MGETKIKLIYGYGIFPDQKIIKTASKYLMEDFHSFNKHLLDFLRISRLMTMVKNEIPLISIVYTPNSGHICSLFPF